MKDHSPPKSGEVKKFRRFRWKGPFVVTSRPYPGVYMLKWKDSGKKWQSPMAQEQLKGYIQTEEETKSNDTLTAVEAAPEAHTPRTGSPPEEATSTTKQTGASQVNPRPVEAPDSRGGSSQPAGLASILKKRIHPSNDDPQPAKVTGILKKRIHRSGERQYQVKLQNGEVKWINEDDTPLSLIPEFEAKWQHNKYLKDIRDAPPHPSKGTRRSSRFRKRNINHLTFQDATGCSKEPNAGGDQDGKDVPTPQKPEQASFWNRLCWTMLICITFYIGRASANVGRMNANQNFNTQDRLQR
jgi:hypothetical protein